MEKSCVMYQKTTKTEQTEEDIAVERQIDRW
jgi:hypothetical protein